MFRSAAWLAAALLSMLGLHVFADEKRLLETSDEAKQGWVVEGRFAPGGVYPISDGTALARSEVIGTSPVLWGSWIGDDRNTGTLRSAPFAAPALLAVLVTGYPNAADNSLWLERERDGAKYRLRMSSPGRRWSDERFFVPRGFRGERVHLVAIDGATEPPGWLGVSTPRRLTPSAWLLAWSTETSPIPLGAAAMIFGLAPALWWAGRESLGQAQRQALSKTGSALVRRGAPLALGCVCLLHLAVLYRYAVDVPYAAEWRHLSGGLAPDLSAQWLWSRLDDQRIFFTKLHTWLLLRAGGWNLRSQILQNFALYGAVLAAAFALLRRSAPHVAGGILLWFFLVPLSPIAHESHAAGIGSHRHFALLFVLLCAHFAFHKESIASALAAAALGVAAIVSSALAAASMAALLAVYTVYTIKRVVGTVGSTGARTEASRTTPFVSGQLMRFSLIALPIGLAIGAGAGGDATASLEAWPSVLQRASTAFGVTSESTPLAAFWALVAAAPLVMRLAVVARSRDRLVAGDWLTLALFAALLAGLCVGSPSLVGLASEQTKRSAGFAALLLPLSAVAWSSLLAARPVARRRVLASLFALSAFASIDDWNTEPYRLARIARESGLACAAHYYQQGGAGLCHTIASQPIARELDRARALELHFERRLRAEEVD